MNVMTTLIFLLVATGQQSAEGTQNDQAAKAKSQRLLELHTNDAASYSILPRPQANGEARAEARACRIAGPIPPGSVGKSARFLSGPTAAGRRLSAASSRTPRRTAGGSCATSCTRCRWRCWSWTATASEQWAPQAAGVDLKPLEGAPPPAGTAAQRLRPDARPGPRVHRTEPERPGPDLGAAPAASTPVPL